MLGLLVAGSPRAAIAQRDTTAKSASRDSASANVPVATIAQAEASGIKLLGISDANTGGWIDHATVRDTLGDETLTSDIGVAALSELRPLMGYYMLEVRKPGYTPQRFKLKADTSEEFLVSLTPNPLGQATVLPAMTTTAAMQSLERDPGLRQGFFTRCQSAFAACVGPKDVELRPTEQLEGLVANTHGITIKCPTTRGPGDDATCLIKMLSWPILPGSKPVPDGLCNPTFFLNGREWSALAGGSQQQLNQFVVPANIDGIEIYLSGQPRPIRWAVPNSNCGAIVIWTH
jgi:hypothetical protein